MNIDLNPMDAPLLMCEAESYRIIEQTRKLMIDQAVADLQRALELVIRQRDAYSDAAVEDVIREEPRIVRSRIATYARSDPDYAKNALYNARMELKKERRRMG